MSKRDVALFFDKLEKDEDLKRKLNLIEDELRKRVTAVSNKIFNERCTPIINELGINLPQNKLSVDSLELSEDSLKEASGGKTFCMALGGGNKCGCFVGGYGKGGCFCPLYGYGK